jgi:hypothetical protein
MTGLSLASHQVAASIRVFGTSRTKVSTTPASASAARAARNPSVKRLGATLRMDAPFGVDPLGYAQTLVSHLTADEDATGALLVIYTDENRTDNPRPYSEYVEA